MANSKKREIYAAILRAAAQGKGLRLSSVEVWELAQDSAIAVRAEYLAANASGVEGNRAACEVGRDAAKCWRQPCVDARQCTAPAGVRVDTVGLSGEAWSAVTKRCFDTGGNFACAEVTASRCGCCPNRKPADGVKTSDGEQR